MKISLASIHKTSNPNLASGVPYFFYRNLKNKATVEVIDGLYKRYTLKRAVAKVLRKGIGKHFLASRLRSTAKRYAKSIDSGLANSNAEILISLDTQLVPYLEASIPKVIYHDLTFADIVGSYPYSSGLFNSAEKEAHHVEEKALQKADHIVWTNDRALNTAKEYYGISDSKMSVIPRGANLVKVPGEKPVKNNSTSGAINILFVCTDWERKGGPIVLDTVDDMRGRGIKVDLNICGVKPPRKGQPVNYNYLGRIDKSRREDRILYRKLLKEADLFFLPTKADAAPIAICEAQAFGIPVVASRAGGVPTLIKNEYNGLLLEKGAKAREYASSIIKLFDDSDLYQKLSDNARREYEERFNWPGIIENFMDLFENILD